MSSAVLALLGIVAGLVYVGLGVSALKYVKDQSRLSEVDRVAGWSLWWWIEKEKYNPVGQRLCLAGAVTFAIGIVSWVLWFVLRE
jgi:hypothetical protein